MGIEETNQPKVIGLEVEEARRRLQAAGVQTIRVVETAPLQQPIPTGPKRVIRQRSREGEIEITAAASVPPPCGEHDNDGNK